MNYYHLAVISRQVAEMLDAGFPLEQGLHRAALSMRAGKNRREFQRLEEDLKQGTPLQDAVRRRRLPSFYKSMLSVGCGSDALAAVLRQLADYYLEKASIRSRLVGLTVYPMIVLVCMGALSLFISLFLLPRMVETFFRATGSMFPSSVNPELPSFLPGIIGPPAVILLLLVVFACVRWIPAIRTKLARVVPPFSYRNIANLAGLFDVGLGAGMTLRDILQLLMRFERGETVRRLKRTDQALSEGENAVDAIKTAGLFPSFSLWMLRFAGDNLKDGFHAIASYYANHARSTADTMLYGGLSSAIILLGGLALWQYSVLGKVVINIVESLVSLTQSL